MTDWGKPCDRCGHPASYHGVTFCLVRAGAAQKRDCDCPGYAAVGAAAPILLAHHEADAAERIAQAIDQAWAQVKDATGTDDFTAYREGYLDGLEHAEGIARTTLRQPHDPEAHT